MIQSLLTTITYTFIFMIISCIPNILSDLISLPLCNVEFFYMTFLLLLIFYIIKKRNMKFIKEILFNKIPIKLLLIIILFSISLCIFQLNIFASIFKMISNNDIIENLQKTSQSISKHSVSTLGIIYVCVLAPIFEELFFRGLLFYELRKTFNIFFTIFIQALAFAFIHFNLFRSLNTFASGLILGYIFYITKSIYSSIIIHITINCFCSINSSILGLVIYDNCLFFFVNFAITFIFIFIIIKYSQIMKIGISSKQNL